MKHKKGSAIEVEWIDSMKACGWHDYQKSDMNCRTVGIFHSEDDERIVIAQNQSSCGYGDYMEIPKIAVKRVRRLKQ